MPIFSDSFRTNYPSFPDDPFGSPKKRTLCLENPPEKELDPLSSPGLNMTGSPGPFIKDEPDDWQQPNRFVSDIGMAQQFNNQGLGNPQGEFSGVNPSDLTMSASFNNQFGNNNNMPSSFIQGHANIPDDELLDLNMVGDMNNQQNNFNMNDQPQHGYVNEEQLALNTTGSQMNAIFSNTPDGAPIQSPFINGFNYAQMQDMRGYHPMPTQANIQSGSFDMHARTRAKMPHGMERQTSDSRSPLTPKTAAMSNLHIGTPEAASFPTHMMANQMNHRHQKSNSSHWDNTPGSGQSWIDSPTQSPMGGSLHPQISEIIASGKHASLPAKVEGQGGHPGYQSQEQKRRKRRESHNQVERRRRDNINERIQDLSKLVPQHRLEDEKVRKHIQNNGPLSPSIAASGISPPHATSLLAGPNGRRAAGSITQGLPIEDKEKGPNKGDILNGAVSWTRDLMWLAFAKVKQEEEMKAYVESIGGKWPFEAQEDELRMRSELIDAIERNGQDLFSYTRGPGSGLRVPKHTNVAGDPLTGSGSPQGLSPAMQSTTSGSNSGNPGQQPFWMPQDSHGAFDLKEEEQDYGMEMS